MVGEHGQESTPIEREKFKNWLTEQAEFVKKNSIASLCPILSEVIYEDGTLYMKRRIVDRDATLTFPDTSDYSKFALDIDDSREDLADALEKKMIFVAPTLVLGRMICEKSGLDYADSPYSIVFDDTVQKIAECRLINFHWTDKPRPISFSLVDS